MTTPKRERFWGLYDWAADTWWTEEFGRAKRKRFPSPQAALSYMRDNRHVTASGPRPFYVVRRPRKLPAEVHALVEVVRDWRDGHASWTEIADALKKYEESC